MPTKEATCTCCGMCKPTSKEHFLHTAIARVLLGKMQWSEEKVRVEDGVMSFGRRPKRRVRR
jgi:hypothetical protein